MKAYLPQLSSNTTQKETYLLLHGGLWKKHTPSIQKNESRAGDMTHPTTMNLEKKTSYYDKPGQKKRNESTGCDTSYYNKSRQIHSQSTLDFTYTKEITSLPCNFS